MNSWLDDEYLWYPSGFMPGGNTTPVPSPGTATISIPSRTISLGGLGRINIGGGTWRVSGQADERSAIVQLTNQYELVLQQNLASYQSGRITRDQALSNFDRIWSEYIQALSAFSAAEKERAIADRQRGGKFDWYAAYRVPIGGVGSVPPTTPSLISGDGAVSGGTVGEWLQRNFLWIALIAVAILVLK